MSLPKSLFIQAPNIRHGGGLLLLKQILHSAKKKKIDVGGNFSSKLNVTNRSIVLNPKEARFFAPNFFQ